MKALSLSLTLALSANAVVAVADALDCETILASEDSDGNIGYFKRTNGRFPEKAAKLAMIRDAVSDYYGECGKTWNADFCYRPEMTDAEVDELGENVGFRRVKGLNGRVYHEVNVGFGGGNGASYYFDAETGAKEQVMIVDHDDCRPIQSLTGYEG